MAAYYNEIEPYAAQWLRNLIKAGHIAPGYVDERSIMDVKAEDLRDFTQCHFFAGIGVWSLALRNAGWPDDRAVWTGSCPCQPFSTAGNQLGTDDARHLAPVWLALIAKCQPAKIFGEQVAAAIKKHWLDDLFLELERQGYACGASVLPACAVGAPHIRERLWFGASLLADPYGEPCKRGGNFGAKRGNELTNGLSFDGLADASGFERGEGDAQSGGLQQRDRAAGEFAGSGKCCPVQLERVAYADIRQREQQNKSLCAGRDAVNDGRSSGGLADAAGHRQLRTGTTAATQAGQRKRFKQFRLIPHRSERCSIFNVFNAAGLADLRMADPNQQRSQGFGNEHNKIGRKKPDVRPAGLCDGAGIAAVSGTLNGRWADADWLLCKDGKWRTVEAGTFPLADGIANRVGRLRAYGNCIVSEAATQFIKAFEAALMGETS